MLQFLQSLSPYITNVWGFLGMSVVVIALVVVRLKENRFRRLIARIEKFPEKERLEVVKQELHQVPPPSMTAEQYIKYVKVHYRYAFVFLLVVLVAGLVGMAVYGGFVPLAPSIVGPGPHIGPPRSSIKSVYNTSWVNDMEWSPKGDYLAIATGEHGVAVLKPSVSTGTWSIVATYTTMNDASVNGLAWSPDGTYLALAESHDVRLWNWQSGTFVGGMMPSLRVVTSVAWSPDGTYIASASNDNEHIAIQVWDAMTQSSVKMYSMSVGVSQSAELVWCLSWSPDSKSLAFASPGNAVITWDVENQSVHSYSGHSNSIYQVLWSHNGNYILASSADKSVIVWDVASGAKRFTFTGHSDVIKAAVWSPKDDEIASASYDGKVIVWDINGKNSHVLYTPYIATTLAWSPDGTYLAFGGNAKDNDGDSDVWVYKFSYLN